MYRNCHHSTISKANEEKNAEMEFCKRLKFWKRAGNRKTGVIRGILNCLVPCIWQTSRSPSPRRSRSPSPERIIKGNKTKENHKETSYGRTGAHSESLMQSGSPVSFEMSRGKEKFWRRMWRRVWNLVSPCIAQFDGISYGETEPDFKVLEEIKLLGQGAFGEVRLVRKRTGSQSSSEEMLAVKTVPRRRVFKVEKKVFLEAKDHPFLVQMVAYYSTRDAVYYHMEYLKGGNLQYLLSRLWVLRKNVARFYSAEIVLAVKFLHSRGIVHRDIKPDNILLDKDGHCKLGDFGLCADGVFAGNKTTGFFGTRGYMAPEIEQDLPYGTEVDWYSVGRVMMDMMMGQGSSLKILYHPLYRQILTPNASSILVGVRLDLRHSFVENWL